VTLTHPKKFTVVIACILLAALNVPLAAQPGDACTACRPGRFNESNLSGEYIVCLDGGLSDDIENGYRKGMEYWNEMLQESGLTDIEFTEGTSDCDITVGYADLDEGLAAYANGTPNGEGASIDINGTMATTGTENYWARNAAHEFGHLLDWTNVDLGTFPACAGKTVMANPPSSSYSPAPLVTDVPLCADKRANEERYVAPYSDSYGDDETHGPYVDENEQEWFQCDVHYIIEDHYVWDQDGNGNWGWRFSYQVKWVDYVDNCVPLL
jgi:hypothetical protein